MAKKNAHRRSNFRASQVDVALPAAQREAFNTAFQREDYSQALRLAEGMVQHYSEVAAAHELHANVLGRLGRFSEASEAMAKVLKLSKTPSVAQQLKLAQYQVLAGKAELAVAALEGVVQAESTDLTALIWLSRAYHHLGNNRQALEVNDQAFALGARNEEVLLWRARILDQLKHHDDALETLNRLLTVNPKRIGVHNHIATLCVKEGDYKKAEEHFEKELELDPTNGQVHSNLLMSAHYNPDYSVTDILSQVLEWERRFAKTSQLGRASTLKDPKKRLRIGLLSGGFRVHPVGQMILPALQHLSSEQFELVAYSTNQFSDKLTRDIQQVVHRWQVVEGLSDAQLDQKIREDGVDILIDMNGAGEGSRYDTLTREPAPIIVKWVGNLINTTGLSCVDYLLSDCIETPQGIDELYTEKLIRLPDDYICYLIPDHAPPCNALPALSNGYITFGCLNNPAKLSSSLLAEWAKLLNEIPRSKLLLRGIQFDSARYRDKITSILVGHGVAADRLILEGPAHHQEFMATYQRIDIALDTWPYSGGLTTCEALMMGVPVVTRVGPTFAGRHSATHLVNAGLPELVTDDWEEFRKRAKELASDLPNLAVIRAALRTILTESPICDGPRFANHLTKALRAIWQRHCKGQPPEALSFNKAGEHWFENDGKLLEFIEASNQETLTGNGFEWQLDEPVTIIDNAAVIPRHPGYLQWVSKGNLAVISFDPASLLNNGIEELQQHGELHHYPHVVLGNGQPTILYAAVEAEKSSTLTPLPEEQQPEFLRANTKTLVELPINTIRLDDIEGIPSVDMLVLDDHHDAMKVLENGEKTLKNTLLLQVRVAFQRTHERQPDLAEVQCWATRNGFRFHTLQNLQYHSHSTKEIPVEQLKESRELVSADALFLPNQERGAELTAIQDAKLSYLLSMVQAFGEATPVQAAKNEDADRSVSHTLDRQDGLGARSDSHTCKDRFIHIKCPLIYGISLFDEHVSNAAKNIGLDYHAVDKEGDIIKKVSEVGARTLIFTGHSYYNLTVKSPPYIMEDKNIFDIFNVVPFSIIDDHAYADFMLHRCKKAPREIIIGSTSSDLLEEFEVVSGAKKVHKIKVPPKAPAVDYIPFNEKENRAVFLGKLYDNVPKNKAGLKNKVLADNRLSKIHKDLIMKMIEGRENDAFFSLQASDLNVDDLVLLYFDLVDKYFRNFHRERELEKIARAFKKQSIPVHIVGGDESSWSFAGKEDCVFWPKMSYKEAISFLHKSKYNINLTPSYSDILTGRAIDMMGSNSLCVSDYSPFYETMEKNLVYFGCDYICSKEFTEEISCKAAELQKNYIVSLYGKEQVEEEWRRCIVRAYEILEAGPGSSGSGRDDNGASVSSKEAMIDVQRKRVQEMHDAELQRLKSKDKIRVVFLAIHRSAWKVDTVFQEMLRDPCFDPVVLVCPDANKGNKDLTFLELNETYRYFKEKRYPVFSSWLKTTKKWRSLDSLLPDIVFFTNPHGLTLPEYYDKAFLSHLTCYVPYTYQVAKYNNCYQLDYNQAFHNYAWKIYAPHNKSYEISREYADNKGGNVVVSGYPLVEDLLDFDSKVSVWKKQSAEKKKIIWAPHHSVGNKNLPFSNFDKLSKLMVELSQTYKDEVQWAFKPHPLLREKLYAAPGWGKEATDNYYSHWASGKHTQLEEGEYKNLFQNSDALIHDSVSFLAEYLVLDKPVMFLENKEVNIKDFLTPFGLEAYDGSLKGIDLDDVKFFVKSIVHGNDPGEEQRQRFLTLNKDIYSNEPPSKKIVQDLKKSLLRSC